MNQHVLKYIFHILSNYTFIRFHFVWISERDRIHDFSFFTVPLVFHLYVRSYEHSGDESDSEGYRRHAEADCSHLGKP